MESSPQTAEQLVNGLTYGVDTRLADATESRDQAKSESMSASPTAATVAEISDDSTLHAIPGAENFPGTSNISMSFASAETTIIELISTTATTSAFPESFGLSISSSGRWILAYSSSALYILAAQRLPEYKDSCRAFKLRRKPLAAAITDGGKLAILTTPHKIDIYQCGEGASAPLSGASQTLKAVHLDYEAQTIAFTADGDVIAAGSDGGIELRNLSTGALATDKRQITCGSLDTIAFSGDGRSLLITAAARRTRTSTFISVNGAYEDAMFDDEAFDQLQPLGKMWITQLLFPERLQARQAVFLPDANTGQITELLAFDSEKDRYGLFDINSKHFLDRTLGTPDDFRWSRSERLEDALPAISADASHIAVAVRLNDNSEIWLYHIPRQWRDMDSAHDSGNDLAEQLSTLTPSLRLRLPPREDNQPAERLVSLRWLRSNVNVPSRGRLFALVSTVALSMPEDVVPSEAPAASGKVFVFDLIRSSDELPETAPRTVTIDLDSIPPIEHLAEEQIELEQEVDLVRRRTTRAQRGRDLSGLPSPRDPRSARRSLSSGSSNGAIVTLRDLAESSTTRPRRRRSFSSMSSMSEENLDISPLAVDEPYANTQPRSQFSLHRAATVAANSPANRAHLRSLPNQPLEYRRADGLREMPHESDADDWVPPPPPYSERPDPPGPNAVSLPISAVAGVASPIPQPPQPSTQAMPSSRNASHPPSSLQQPTGMPQMSQIPSPGPGSEFIPPVPTLQSSLVTRRLVARLQPQVDTVSPRTQIPTLPAVTTIPPSPATAQPLQPLSPPGPGALQSPFTFPPAARSSRLSNPNLHIAPPQHNMAPRSASTPASPVNMYQSNQWAVAITDFQPAMRLPTLEQMETLHRRSSSGGSVPRAAMGAMGNSRRVSSAELNRPLPPIPPDSRNVIRHSSDGPLRPPMRERLERHRPALARLATIASVVSRTSAGDPVVEDTGVISPPTIPQSEPTTPTGRLGRWRVTSGRTSLLANFDTVDSGRQSAPPDDRPLSSKGGSKKKGLKCIVM